MDVKYINFITACLPSRLSTPNEYVAWSHTEYLI
jgi:hypothetical protein